MTRSHLLRSVFGSRWHAAALVWIGLLSAPLAAQPYDEFVLLVDTSSSMNQDRRFARLKTAVDDFADSIPPDGASRVWLLTYDSGLDRAQTKMVLRSETDKQGFKVALQSIPKPDGSSTRTWTALGDTLALVESSFLKGESRRSSVHLFTDGEADDSKVFVKTLERFGRLRATGSDLRLYYHALDYVPPVEVTSLATKVDSGIIIIPGLAMPPQIVPEKIHPPGTRHLSGTPRAWIGAAVGAVEQWSWDFGDGQTSRESNPTHTYARSGRYTIEVRAVNKAGGDTRRFAVEVKSGPPKAGFQVSGAYAEAEIVFTDTSQGEIDSREWSIDGRPAGRATVLRRVFPAAGVVAVSLAVSGPGGTDRHDTKLRLESPPKAAFTWTPDQPRRGQPVAFINESTNLTEWSWEFGDGSPPATERNPRHTFSTAGRFQVTLSGRSPEGKVLRQTRAIEVLTDAEPPVARIAKGNGGARGGPVLIGEPIAFREESAGTIERYVWNFGDGSRAEGRTPSHVYTEPKSYSVVLTVTGPLGESTATVTCEVAEPGWKIVSGSQPVWVGARTRFSLQNAPPHLRRTLWNFGDNSTLQSTGLETSVEHVYTKTGTYMLSVATVLQVGDGPAVKRQITTNVEVQVEKVTLAFGITGERALTLGKDQPRRLIGPAPLKIKVANRSSGPIQSFAWDFGDGTISDEREPVHAYRARGTYQIALRAVDARGQNWTIPQSEGFVVEVTGWRPPPSWRWPAALAVLLLLTVGWRLSPWQLRRIYYEQNGVRETHRSWTRDFVLGHGQSAGTLRLRRNLWLRKTYVLVRTGTVEWHDKNGARPNRKHLARHDGITVAGQATKLLALNHGTATGLVPVIVILLFTAAVLRAAWNLFV